MEAKGLVTEVDVSSINVDRAHPEFAQLVDRVAACFSVRRHEGQWNTGIINSS